MYHITKQPFGKQVLNPVQMKQITFSTVNVKFLSNNFFCGLEKPLE